MYEQSRKGVRNIAAKLQGLKYIPVFSTPLEKECTTGKKREMWTKIIDAWINEKLDLFVATMRASSVLAWKYML